MSRTKRPPSSPSVATRMPRDQRRDSANPKPDSTPPQLRPLIVFLSTERGLAKNSVDAYRRDLTDTLIHLQERGKDLQSACAQDYRNYLQDQSRKKQSTKTVARRLAAIRVYLKFCEVMGQDKQEILQQLERPKPERPLPKIMSRDQVTRLISAPDPEHRLYFRDVAILELLYAAGVRASELCGMNVRDANLQVGVVRVLGKGSKERIIPIGKACVGAIARYLQEGRPMLLKEETSEKLFLSRSGKAFDRMSLWNLVRKHADASGVSKECSPHTLRHCFASHLLGGGADLRIVQELLGHSDVTTTQIYTHVDTTRLISVHKKYHPRG